MISDVTSSRTAGLPVGCPGGPAGGTEAGGRPGPGLQVGLSHGVRVTARAWDNVTGDHRVAARGPAGREEPPAVLRPGPRPGPAGFKYSECHGLASPALNLNWN